MTTRGSFRVPLVTLLLGACGAPAHPDTPPSGAASSSRVGVNGNILILLVDDVGVDKVSAASPLDTPNIDQLATSGMRFDNAWALPFCEPTRAAIMTGRHARRTGHGSNDPIHLSPNELDPGQWTLAEVVAESPLYGYDTSYVGKWHLSTFVSKSGTSAPVIQGWNWYTGVLGNPGVWFGARPEGEAAPGYFLWQKIDTHGQWSESRNYVTTDNVDEAIGRLDTMQEPWLMQVAFTAAHGPYDVPPAELLSSPLTGGTVQRREQAIIEALDLEIGRLLGAMPTATRDGTTILFLSDNGTPHLAVEADVDPDRAKGSVYEPGVHVPLIVSGPLVGVRGSTSQALVHVVDILPTVADIAGVDLSTFPSATDRSVRLALDGESLVPLLADPDARPDRDVLYTERFGPSGPGPYGVDVRAVRDERYKLILDAVSGTEQFFELPIGGTDEGPDLLPCGLTRTQEAARARLRAAMDRIVEELVFDAEPFVEQRNDPDAGSQESPLLTDISCVEVAAR